MTDTTERKLFAPVQIGPMTLKHRVVMAPLTSQQPGDIPGALMREHYTQRASDGGLIVSEATAVSVTARGWLGAPGLYSDPQVEGLSKITQAVHAKGGRMFSQLWHTGRSSHTETTGGPAPVSASVNPAYWADASRVVSAPSGWIRRAPRSHRSLCLFCIAPRTIDEGGEVAPRWNDGEPVNRGFLASGLTIASCHQ